MNNLLYWFSAITYAFILLTILINDIRLNKTPDKLEKNYRMMTLWVLLFCVQDILWGLCADGIIVSDRYFFVSSSIFHISTVLTTFFWLNYVLVFLEDKLKNKKKLYLALDGLVILLQITLVIVNIFKPVIFTIQDGVYVTESLRPLIFLDQYIIYLIIGVISAIFSIKETGKSRKRYMAVFSFALMPILTGLFQFFFPYGPFYSMGYFLGCFIVHIFIVSKDREEHAKNEMLESIASTYYSMHIVDIKNNTIEPYIQSDILTKLIGSETDTQKIINRAFEGSSSPEYLELVLDFVNISTLNERMNNKKALHMEFIGIHFGWTRISFIRIDENNVNTNKVLLLTQIIDSEKRSQIELLFRSNNDELTGLYNRRAFENDIEKYRKEPIENDLILICMDVNELKVINDTKGHSAGDELLKGAADCMIKALSAYGKIYRTGGDEFNAIIYADKDKIESIISYFDSTIYNWSGKLVNSLSISYGFVARCDYSSVTFHDMTIIADEKMYEAKTNYYREKGVDRRGQHDAHTSLCATYTKILKTNLTDDSFQIVNFDYSEQTEKAGYSEKLSEWMSNFGKAQMVHPDDLQDYLKQTDINNLRNHFHGSVSPFRIFYRRKIGDCYRKVMLEIIPANDYAADNQSMFLYVKDIDE